MESNKNSKWKKALIVGSGDEGVFERVIGHAVDLFFTSSPYLIRTWWAATPATPVFFEAGDRINGSWTALANSVGKAEKNTSSLEERISKVSWTIR